MALPVGQIGDNPQQPGIYAETYIPDQLIAGNMKIVTDNATVSGSVALPRGALLGQITIGTISSSAGRTNASGTVLIAALPTAGDTLTIAGTPITFVAVNPSGNQVMIGGPGVDGNPVPTPTIAGTATALISLLNGSSDVNLIKSTYSLAGATITVTAVVAGTGGNALALATSNATAFTLSAATLAGGTANTGAETIGTISAGPNMKTGVYQVVVTSATTFNVIDPIGDLIGNGTVGTAFVDQQINLTVTTGAGIAAGDRFVLSTFGASGNYVLAVASALDGSQVPSAVLADAADPTSGAVNAPIYLQGEFNANYMTFGAGISALSAKAMLRPLNIYMKTSVTAADPS